MVRIMIDVRRRGGCSPGFRVREIPGRGRYAGTLGLAPAVAAAFRPRSH